VLATVISTLKLGDYIVTRLLTYLLTYSFNCGLVGRTHSLTNLDSCSTPVTIYIQIVDQFRKVWSISIWFPCYLPPTSRFHLITDEIMQRLVRIHRQRIWRQKQTITIQAHRERKMNY